MDLNREEIADLPYRELIARIDKAGGQRAFARLTGIPRTTLQDMIEAARLEQFKHIPAKDARTENVAPGENVRRFILTAAQDMTKVHEGFLTNLEAYRDYLSEEGRCDILIAGFTYNKRLFEDHTKTSSWFADRAREYLIHERIRIGDVIDFCGEMNTLPTAENPLSGFETYTRHRWGIFPHAKVQLRSVPTMKHEPAKQIMTTGVCTLPNYVQKRAGIKATFHHIIGAVMVELRESGEFFCRHLLAEDDGSFYDLDMRVEGGQVSAGHRIEALNPGDIHTAQIDPVVAKGLLGFYPDQDRNWIIDDQGDSLLAILNPKYVFVHDVADFQSRNHHNLHDPHHMFALHCQGTEDVRGELQEVAAFCTILNRLMAPDGEVVVVESNHNQALTKWLKTADWRYDPRNALFFIECTKLCLEAIQRGEHDFSIFEHVLTNFYPIYDCKGVRFLKLDESFKVLGIEKGMHGHLGANGARGSPHAFTRMGSKATTGHTHSCEIKDGIYTAGTCSKLDMGYNTGLSSWSHSHVITYANGKRTIITFNNGLWCAYG